MGSSTSRPGLPPVLAAEATAPFVGREAEVRALATAWDDARISSAGRRLAVIVGEPGVGKTRFAASIAASIAADGAPVLAGRADEGLRLPFQPFAEAIRHHIDQSGRLGSARHLAAAGADLSWLVPELGRDPRHGTAISPEAGRYRLFEAVTAYFGSVTEGGAALLVLDDLQWADRDSLALLRHLLRADGGPLLVIATVRDTEPATTTDFRNVLAELWNEAVAASVRLAGLSEANVIELVSSHGLPGDVQAIGRRLHERSNGNSFFVRQLMGHLAESDDDLPASVVDVVHRRLWRLPDVTVETLAAAAVAGPHFDLPIVARMVNRSEDEALSAIEEAVAARLIHERPEQVDRFAFDHALVRDTLLADVTSARQARFHARALAAIESLRSPDRYDSATLADLARHACASDDRALTTRAVDYARRAAADADDRFAFDDAAGHLERALMTLDEPGLPPGEPSASLRCSVELELGRVLERAEDFAASRRHYEAALELARALDDRHQFAVAALGVVAEGVQVGRVDAQEVELLDEAIRLVPADSTEVRVRLHAALARELLFSNQVERLVPVAEAGVAIARTIDDQGLLSHALGGLHQALLGPGRPAARLAIADEIVALANASGDVTMRRWAYAYRVIDRLQLLDTAGAIDDVHVCAELSAAERPPRYHWWSEALLAMVDLSHGAFASAEARIEEANLNGRATGDMNAPPTWIAQRFVLRWCQGRLEEMVAFTEAPDIDDQLPVWRAAMAAVAAETSRPLAAERLLDSFRDDLQSVPVDSMRVATLAFLAFATYRADDAVLAAEVAGHLAVHQGTGAVLATGTAFLGSADAYLGLACAATGDVDKGIDLLEHAAVVNARMNVDTWTTFATAWLGELLITRHGRSDLDRAMGLLASAADRAVAIGMTGVRTRCRALLAAVPTQE